MANTDTLNLGTMMADATMRAAADILRRERLDVDLDALVIELRTECKAALHEVLDNGQEVLMAAGGAWLSNFVTAACCHAAHRAISTVKAAT